MGTDSGWRYSLKMRVCGSVDSHALNRRVLRYSRPPCCPDRAAPPLTVLLLRALTVLLEP
jgi:hypothetical protein